MNLTFFLLYYSLNDLRIMSKGRSSDIIIHQKKYKSFSFFARVIFSGFQLFFRGNKAFEF